MIRSRAARPSAYRPGSLHARLEMLRDDVDQLLSDLVDGPRSAQHFDALEERADTIRRELKAAFREQRGQDYRGPGR